MSDLIIILIFFVVLLVLGLICTIKVGRPNKEHLTGCYYFSNTASGLVLWVEYTVVTECPIDGNYIPMNKTKWRKAHPKDLTKVNI